MRTYVGGALIILGCATLTVFTTGMLLAMPLQSGRGLAVAMVAMVAAICSLGVGFLIAFAR